MSIVRVIEKWKETVICSRYTKVRTTVMPQKRLMYQIFLMILKEQKTLSMIIREKF